MPSLHLESLRCRGVEPVDLELAAGECVALSGPSGAGKTLLLRAIVDLDPHQGEARLDGTASQTMPAHLWRRRVGLLPAEPRWWHADVGAHFTERDVELVTALGFAPEVYQWPVERLSSGERQRLALARLLVRLPHAVLLDEPTANLDLDQARAVERLVGDYAHRHAAPVLWVTHDREQIARIAARHFRLASGRLAEVER